MTTDAPKLPMPPKPLKPPRNTEHAAGRSCPTCRAFDGKSAAPLALASEPLTRNSGVREKRAQAGTIPERKSFAQERVDSLGETHTSLRAVT